MYNFEAQSRAAMAREAEGFQEPPLRPLDLSTTKSGVFRRDAQGGARRRRRWVNNLDFSWISSPCLILTVCWLRLLRVSLSLSLWCVTTEYQSEIAGGNEFLVKTSGLISLRGIELLSRVSIAKFWDHRYSSQLMSVLMSSRTIACLKILLKKTTTESRQQLLIAELSLQANLWYLLRL